MAQGRLRFHGAVRNVTGSRHLLEWQGERILLDCGLVQGRRREAWAANAQLPFEPKEIDHCILSHAHIDHSGALPVLVRSGYRGKIWATPATVDLCGIMLRDAGAIQESDAGYLNKRRKPDEPPIEPLYTVSDSERTLPRLRGVPYREQVDLSDNVSFELLDAGHILGSAMVVLTLRAGNRSIRVAFTGDHGRRHMPILRDPARLPPVDYLITESTYGDRTHQETGEMEQELRKLVEQEQRDGGRIVIPAFALGRTQNLVYMLGRLRARGEIPDIPIFVDSPLAREATQIVARHAELFDSEVRAMLARGQAPFFFDGIRYVRDAEESKGLNAGPSSCIIISASGMCESGRVLHHLKQTVGRPEDCVLIVGFQAPHTLGRRLVEGQRELRILGDRHERRCQVRVISGLSAHADSRELLESLSHLASDLRGTFVVHGESDAAFAFRDKLRDKGFRDVVVPVEGEAYDLAV